MSVAQLVFSFPFNATYAAVRDAVAAHFADDGADDAAPEQRDPTAVFTGTSQTSVTVGTNPATSQPAIEVDGDGFTWDERIHSSSKAKTEKNLWRLRKGVTPTVVAQVKAEQLAARGASSGAVMQPSGNVANLHNTSDDARAARIAYAKEQAAIVAGPNPLMPDDFEKLQRGQLVTISPHGAQWFEKWQAAFNAAYSQYAEQTAAQTAYINPAAVIGNGAVDAPVQMSQTQPVAAAAPVADFASFCAKYAAHLASPQMTTVLGQLGITAGFSALATQPAMIPAVVALLAAQGIV